MEVVRQHPQLLERLMVRMARITEQFTAAARTLLEQHADGRRRPDRPVSDAGRGNPADDLRGRYSRGDQAMDDDRLADLSLDDHWNNEPSRSSERQSRRLT